MEQPYQLGSGPTTDNMQAASEGRRSALCVSTTCI